MTWRTLRCTKNSCAQEYNLYGVVSRCDLRVLLPPFTYPLPSPALRLSLDTALSSSFRDLVGNPSDGLIKDKKSIA